MEKVMILGAGRGQIPLMNLCHKYGWQVIAVSPQGNYPGFQVADQVYLADIKEEQTVLDVAQQEDIQAILTDQLDESVYTAAYVAEKMNLPGITCDVAQKFTNKTIMRKVAEDLGISVPISISVNDVDDVKNKLAQISDLQFPLIMKPEDSSASRGVCWIKSWADIEKKFDYSKQYSKSGKVILEQYIKGKEYVIDAYTNNGRTTNLVVGHRDYFQIPEVFIPNATVFRDANSATSELECRLKKLHKMIVDGFGLNFGITHGEYLFNEKQDKIYFVEIAARGGGVFISSDLIPGACGVNVNDLLVREALGIGNHGSIQISKGASAYFCYLLPPGTVSKLEGTDEVELEEGVIRAYFDNIYVGMQSDSITDKSSRKGPILVRGETKDDCYSVIERVKKKLIIKVYNGIQELDVIWHDM